MTNYGSCPTRIAEQSRVSASLANDPQLQRSGACDPSVGNPKKVRAYQARLSGMPARRIDGELLSHPSRPSSGCAARVHAGAARQKPGERCVATSDNDTWARRSKMTAPSRLAKPIAAVKAARASALLRRSRAKRRSPRKRYISGKASPREDVATEAARDRDECSQSGSATRVQALSPELREAGSARHPHARAAEG